MNAQMKKLPKAISRTASDMREAQAEDGTWERQGTPVRPTYSNNLTDGVPPPREIGRMGDIIEMAPMREPNSAPATSTLVRAQLAHAEVDAERRRSLARSVVERHATYSAVGGIIPLPIANVASITAVIVRMVRTLSILYGVPFDRDRARAVVVGLMAGAMPTGLAAATTSTLVYIVPGSALIGLAVSSIAAVACTRSIGRIFIEHFESGAILNDLAATDSS